VTDTFPKLLASNAREHGAAVALREKEFGIWRSITWAQYEARTRAFALGLKALGLSAGDVVGLIGDNRPDWVMGEIAAHAIGARPLPRLAG
jgi:long-chain acyl-CoA synthetase